ncbi:MAG: insulinase family protein [Cyclobacteriaceae bacterium]|nr:insulinase family protein [Cyclobacteriaceae bacterium]
MIQYSEFILENGLKLVVHEDFNTPLVAVNLLYHVGSKDENPEKTGFAHLFEHLMFGGSVHVVSFDEELQKVGGENNAFTNLDITNYYIQLPADNLETALWLESDRMYGLSFSQEVLDIQKNVVIEEFKQRYLNQPYGDMWLKLRPMAYKEHPYQWPTIGKEISHIESFTMDDVKEFFYTYYRPNNAILSIAGNVKKEEAFKLVNKWFGSIPSGPLIERRYPSEPRQQEARKMEIEDNVPLDAIFKAFHAPGRKSPDFHAAEITADLLGRGKSSRLHTALVKKKNVFGNILAHLPITYDPGLLLIQGRINKGISKEDADAAVREVIQDFVLYGPEPGELEKVKHQAEASLLFGGIDLLNRAMALATGAVLGDTGLVNKEIDRIASVSVEDVMRVAANIFDQNNSNTLYYRSNI